MFFQFANERGKSLSLGEINRSHVLRSPMAPELIFLDEELAVTTPRQLAPTVGPAVMKGVEIIGAARRAMEKLAIGRVYTDEHGETEIDDSGWTSEMNEVDEGYQLVFGRINVFVGMVSTSGVRSNTVESVSEPTVVVESDGEESVGTSEVGIIAESEEPLAEKPEMLQESDSDYDADSESILPLFEDRLGYGIEEEDYEESPVRTRVVGV